MIIEPISSALLPAVTSIGAAVVVLGLLIFVHEFGHFLLAKLSGVGVLKFSLGFGKKLVGIKRGETEYLISAFPLGGYVKMVGEDGDGEEGGELSPEDKKRSFAEQPLYKRAAIVFAGPLFNILLAVVLLYVLMVTGFPNPVAKVRDVAPGSMAAAAGFKSGDVIKSVNGEPTDFWEQAAEVIEKNPGKTLAFKVETDGRAREIKATPADKGGKGEISGLSGSVIIFTVMENSPADKAGIRPKDKVVSIDGTPVASWARMQDVVRNNPGKELDFTVERAGRLMSFKVTPEMKEVDADGVKTVSVIGVQMGADMVNVRYGPVESIGMSLEKTAAMTSFTVAVMARIIKGKESAKEIGGPITIVRYSGRQAKEGFVDFVFFIAMLSVNLGIINLFPIPILDGGHLLFFAIEGIMGKPLDMRKREIAQQVGLFILISLMIFVFYNDLMKVFGLQEVWK